MILEILVTVYVCMYVAANNKLHCFHGYYACLQNESLDVTANTRIMINPQKLILELFQTASKVFSIQKFPTVYYSHIVLLLLSLMFWSHQIEN